MHGRACEERKRGRHMWTAPSRATASVKAIGSSSATSSSLLSSSSPNSFFKDGRKISVGDCALFKPPQDCPPFIGIIRSVTAVKEDQLNLGVSWLYRPAEVKLGKGILLDAAPNEIFYSFHKDEIPAASLLHPCKVAFLPKGVELPSGICSFVCWRVYDITHKCLWWLTDQDYIDERQEEVDQLLCKTRLEMHATVQQGGRSPKPMNGPTSTSQLKTSSDSVHNTGSSFPSQVKGKKRERMDQGSESVKRERIVRVEDTDSVHSKLESTLRSEIAKITEKGGLVDSDGVEKLVQLMVPEGSERKIDLASRSVLAGVVAATDKFDCLSRFVQLRGLPVFDEWLQEVHKGKMGDSTSPKHGDRSIEEFLLILLRALDKLPVNLHALQMCNIGKSVNLLRSHKNVEIQRKARSLVDTWKKRVEAEMDAKSSPGQGVSWSARPRLPEASHGTTKTSVSHPHSSKSSSVKLVQGENSVKSASPSPGSTRSALSPTSGGMNMKDGQQKNFGVAVSDVPPTSVRDEKSSSSSPSHNNSQSYSSDHAKTGGTSGKEDPRCPSTGSLSVNKSLGGSSRHRRSVNGFQGSASSTGHRETGSVKNSSISKNNSVSEKVSQSNSICEKVHELPASEGSAHKLIVKIPNRGRSPTQTTGTTSVEDATVLNRTSSPVVSEKNDQVDQNQKEKTDTYRTIISSDVHNELWQSNDSKDVQAGSVEGGGSPSIPNEERSRSVDTKKPVEAPKASVLDISKESSPHSVDHLKPGKPHENPFGSIYALIESCVKYSEANNAPVAAEDDVGMNLLASVAAGEISKSDMASPTGSPHTNENSCLGNDSKQNLSSDDLSHTLATDGAIAENEKQDFVGGNVETKAHVKPITDPARKFDCNSLKQSANQCLESNGEYRDAEKTSTSVSSANESKQMMDDDTIKASKDIKADGSLADDVSDAKRKLSADTKIGDSGVKVEGEICHPQPFSESNQSKDEQKPSISKSTSELVRTDDCTLPLGSGKCPVSANVNELKAEKADEIETDHHDPTKGQKIEGESSASGNQVGAGLISSVTKFKVEHVGENLDGNEDNEPQSGVYCPLTVSLLTVKGKEEHCAKARESRLNTAGADEADESTSLTGDASSSSAADRDTKVEFDLNEGFSGDDGRNLDLSNLTGAGTSTPVQFPMPLPASVTVAAAAKGPFVPTEDLLRNKGLHGWKGSAATSAFRPAGKPLEGSVGINNTARVDSNTRKQSRLPLDIDLNVPDERVVEDLASRTSGQTSVCDITNNLLGSVLARPAGGLDLDLNKVDETTELENYTSNNHKLDTSFETIKQASIGRMTDEAVGRRDFDLNNGPMVDDVNPEQSIIFGQHAARSSLPSQPSLPGTRVNGADMGNFSSWFPSASYSATVPLTAMPDRDQPFSMVVGGGPQRFLGATTAPHSFNPDLYRGPVLSSSPAVPFQATAPFQYPVFPFGGSFPLSSATFSGGSATYVDASSVGRLSFPTVNSQLLGPAVAVSSNYPRPYVVNLTDGNSSGSGSEAGRKWFRQDLDLNNGPGIPVTEGRKEASSLAPSRPTSASTLAEEQARIFQMASGVVKRKEPEGGWDGYKQSSWH